MKNIMMIIALFAAMTTFGQSTIKTETFTVSGNCDDCKKRIENAADIKGVKLSDWNSDKKEISVTYDSKKTSLELIQKAIAAKGYDAGNIKGDPKAYQNLPHCCQYRDRTHDEK
jgi:copper chaperone CopZ